MPSPPPENGLPEDDPVGQLLPITKVPAAAWDVMVVVPVIAMAAAAAYNANLFIVSSCHMIYLQLEIKTPVTNILHICYKLILTYRSWEYYRRLLGILGRISTNLA